MASESRLLAYNPVTLESFLRSITKHREPCDPYDDGYIDAVDRIQEWLEQNTVDAVEVVRCTECINNECCSIQEAMGESGHCSKGKRKEG